MQRLLKSDQILWNACRTPCFDTLNCGPPWNWMTMVKSTVLEVAILDATGRNRNKLVKFTKRMVWRLEFRCHGLCCSIVMMILWHFTAIKKKLNEGRIGAVGSNTFWREVPTGGKIGKFVWFQFWNKNKFSNNRVIFLFSHPRATTAFEKLDIIDLNFIERIRNEVSGILSVLFVCCCFFLVRWEEPLHSVSHCKFYFKNVYDPVKVTSKAQLNFNPNKL